MTWTTEEARSVPCPKCGAQAGVPCGYQGKGATKSARLGKSHQERIAVMVEARRARPKNKPTRRAKLPPLDQPITITGPLYRP